jgi:hypothetical protein
MTASVPAPAGTDAPSTGNEFDLVESSVGWQLTITLTDRLREALAAGPDQRPLRFAVRIAPNLVPGEPFEAQLRIREPEPEPEPG